MKLFFNKIRQYVLRDSLRKLDASLLLQGCILFEALRQRSVQCIQEAEFKVFSQWGEDGILQFLIERLDIPNKVFIEFGVENYKESNTRFLLIKDNWSGLVIDGSRKHTDFIGRDEIAWKYDLTARCEFINTDNINEILKEFSEERDVGLLSIDIDGNDYWVWKAIDSISPRIVVVEYNSVFGPSLRVTVPYDPKFVRSMAHFSHIYYGASIQALIGLGKIKGYTFLGTNSAGNNAFFVRNDISENLTYLEKRISLAKFREGRDRRGNISKKSAWENLKLIENMDVLDLERSQISLIKDLISSL